MLDSNVEEYEVQEIDCTSCGGLGFCRGCEGDGEGVRHYEGSEFIYSEACPYCYGEGTCYDCNGKGRILSKSRKQQTR